MGFGAHVCYHCRISPPRFLAKCRKRRLNQGSFVLLYFSLSTLFDLYLVFACLFSCTALFVSISQVIGCEDRLRNDLLCVGWGVKLTLTNNDANLAEKQRKVQVVVFCGPHCIFILLLQISFSVCLPKIMTVDEIIALICWDFSCVTGQQRQVDVFDQRICLCARLCMFVCVFVCVWSGWRSLCTRHVGQSLSSHHRTSSTSSSRL